MINDFMSLPHSFNCWTSFTQICSLSELYIHIKHIKCAPLFKFKAYMLVFWIGLVLFPYAFFKGVSVSSTKSRHGSVKHMTRHKLVTCAVDQCLFRVIYPEFDHTLKPIVFWSFFYCIFIL